MGAEVEKVKATAPEGILTAVVARKHSDLLSFPEVVFEKCALTVGKMSFERWLELGELLGEIEGSVQFWIGDYLNAGERAYGEKYSQAVNERQAATWMNYAWVARRVDKALRKEIDLSYKHHEAVAPLEPREQPKWLADAIKNRWGVHELREQIKKSKNPKPNPADDGQRIEPPPIREIADEPSTRAEKFSAGEKRRVHRDPHQRQR